MGRDRMAKRVIPNSAAPETVAAISIAAISTTPIPAVSSAIRIASAAVSGSVTGSRRLRLA